MQGVKAPGKYRTTCNFILTAPNRTFNTGLICKQGFQRFQEIVMIVHVYVKLETVLLVSSNADEKVARLISIPCMV